MIGIGSDHNGFDLKCQLGTHLTSRGRLVWDFGCFSEQTVDYPDIASAVAEAVRDHLIERAVLICGTGLGMAIAANKVPGVYAAPVTDTRVARLAWERNSAQIITLGASVVSASSACAIVDAWLEAEFAGGESGRKVGKVYALEEKYAAHVEPLVSGALT